MRLPDEFYERVGARATAAAAEEGLDGLLLTQPGDVAYLVGFFYAVTERPVYLWFGADGTRLCVVPVLDEEYAQAQQIHADVLTYTEYPGIVTAEERLADELRRRGLTAPTIGYSPAAAVGTVDRLRHAMPGATWAASHVAARLRMVKEPEEITFHRQAAGICDEMLGAGRELISSALRAGRELPTEGELAQHVIGYGTTAVYERYQHVIFTTKLAGGLVYAGPNSSRPHGLPSRRRLQVGDTLILSLGAAVASRFVESERTFVVGEPTADQQRYHDVAVAAQEAGTQAMTPGRPCAEVNAVGLGTIRSAGMEHLIRHRHGHGIGLANHEPPWIDDGDSTPLAPGMVVSSEPGVYVPGHAGYRISDTVLVNADGPERLTHYPRTLAENVIDT